MVSPSLLGHLLNYEFIVQFAVDCVQVLAIRNNN